jgi:hypothetical protein
MRNLKIYSPDGDDANGGDDQGFTDLTQLKESPIVIEEEDVNQNAKEGVDADADTQKKDDADSDKEEDADEPILRLDVTDDEPEEVSSWKEVAMDLGFEVEDDSQEALKEGFERHIEKIKAEAQTATVETNIVEKYGEAGLNLFKAVAATGDSIEALLNPLFQFDQVLAWDDEEKIVAYYEQRGFSKEKAEARYAKDVEEDKVEDLILEIDNNIITHRELKQEEILANGAKKYDDIISLQNKDARDFINKASDELSKRTEFAGIKIDPESMKTVIKRMDAGLYRKAILSDPKLLVDFALNVEFGQKVIKDSSGVAARKAKGETLENLANLDTVQKAASGKGSKSAAPAASASYFDSWKLPEGDVKVVAE